MKERRENKERRQNAKDLRINKIEHRFHIRRNRDRALEKEKIGIYYFFAFILFITVICYAIKYLVV